jgi:hypothetical protein
MKGALLRKLCTWLVVAFAGGALVAGCGASSTTTTTETSPAAAIPQVGATTAPARAATSATGAPTGSATAPSSLPTVAKAPAKPSAVQSAAACKQAIDAQPAISPSVKVAFESICERAAKGDPTAVRSAVRESCVALVDASHLTSAARERALVYCKGK